MRAQKNRAGRTKQRRLGRYYTPAQATSILCKWMIRESSESILEPSFGGCGFLEASRDRLQELGNANPMQSLYGCDIDYAAFGHLERKIGALPSEDRFIHSDFLEVEPSKFRARSFDVVIGNPPYISSHNMTGRQKTRAEKIAKKYEIAPWGHASLWAYFLLHSMAFLRVGGRMAWILPGSVIQAHYAKQIRSLLQKRFRRVLALALRERLFIEEGTDENSIILVAEGYLDGPSQNGIELGSIGSLEEFNSILKSWCNQTWRGEALSENSTYFHFDPTLEKTLSKIKDLTGSRPLSEIADIKIGIVTGANRFFILNEQTRKLLGIPAKATKQIFSKSQFVKGISVRKSSLKRARTQNFRCLLLNTSGSAAKAKSVQKYLRSFSKKERNSILTFKKRPVWHRPDDGLVAHAFFSYMNERGPRIFLNEAKVNCTNSLYRLFFKERSSRALRKAVCISMWTTYSQLSAEHEGRRYGQGVLKHEPSDAGRIRLVLPEKIDAGEVAKRFSTLDKLLQKGLFDEARRSADDFIFQGFSKLNYKSLIPYLESALLEAREKRKPMILKTAGAASLKVDI